MRFNGQFAFGLRDLNDGSLWLVRDRVGIAPLHYAVVGAAGAVIFGSEMKALFASGLVRPQPDLASLAAAFTLWSVPAPSTVFAGIQVVLPGTAIRFDRDLRSQLRVYHTHFASRAAGSGLTIDDAAEQLTGLLSRAVKIRLARRRARGVIPLRRPGFLRDRAPGAPSGQQPPPDVRRAFFRRTLRRGEAQHRKSKDLGASAPRDRRHAGGPGRGAARGGAPRRSADAADRAGADVRPVFPCAQAGYARRADRGGRRRVPWGVRHLQGRQGPALLGARPRLDHAPRSPDPRAPYVANAKGIDVAGVLPARPRRRGTPVLFAPPPLGEQRLDAPLPRPRGARRPQPPPRSKNASWLPSRQGGATRPPMAPSPAPGDRHIHGALPPGRPGGPRRSWPTASRDATPTSTRT